MTIYNVEFPLELSQGSAGEHQFSTDIVATKNGYEYRNKNWSESRFMANVAQSVVTQDDYETLANFYRAMGGQAYGFLFTDPGDYKSCGVNGTPSATDIDLGSGDGSTATFQLKKTYTAGRTETKTITRPNTSTVLVAIDGTAYTTGWTVSASTGIVTFSDISPAVSAAADNGDGTTRITIATAHGLSTGDHAYASTFTGDWAGINGSRYVVTVVDGNRFDIDHDSSGYAAYSSNAGLFSTLPQSGEAITAGFEYYLPCRFDSQMKNTYSNFQAYNSDFNVIEIRE